MLFVRILRLINRQNVRAGCYEYLGSIRLDEVKKDISAVIGLYQIEILLFRRDRGSENAGDLSGSTVGADWYCKKRHIQNLLVCFCFR